TGRVDGYGEVRSVVAGGCQNRGGAPTPSTSREALGEEAGALRGPPAPSRRIMTEPAFDEADLLRRAAAGDQPAPAARLPPCPAVAACSARLGARVGKLVRLRLDRRLAGRIDTSDVIQDTSLDVARRFPEYVASPAVPFYIWLRSLTGPRLIDLHRHHLGAE